ncbi:polymer-forming cytoskeletal protein [Kouleothrix sp.]|uniref:bactofilin family protein n=1 Tax=Kouleothrix sp. TaxID=2779161 RepID=UPI00391B42F4
MFGRRNPDRPLDQPAVAPKSDIDLGMLDDLPTIPPAEPAKPAPADDPWSARTAAMLGPSVMQLLRAAEVSGEPALVAEAPTPAVPAPPAPAPVAPAPPPAAPAVTQQLPALDFDPAIEIVHSQLWQSQHVYAEPEPPAPPTLSDELGIAADSLWAPIAEPEPPAPAPAAPAPAPAAPAPKAAAPELPAAVVAPVPARPNAESVIGPDDFFDGHYRSERGVRIQGAARGAIESRQYILVEAGAQVEAELVAEAITIAGTFTGKIACRGRLEIASTGTVQGAVETVALVVYEGGSLDGELHMVRPAA